MISELWFEFDIPAGMLTLLLLITQEIYFKDKRSSTKSLMAAEGAVCVYSVCRAYSMFLRLDGHVDRYDLVVFANLVASLSQTVAIFFVFIFFLMLTNRKVTKQRLVVYAIPLLVFGGVLLSPLRDQIYTISSRSEFVSGPWSWMSLLYVAIYMTLIIAIVTVHRADFRDRYAAIMVLSLFLLAATYLDYRFATRIDTFVLALCLTAFATILDAQVNYALQKISMYDELSGLKNRYSLMQDFDEMQGKKIWTSTSSSASTTNMATSSGTR